MAPKAAAKKAAAKTQPAKGSSGSAGSPDERWVHAQISALQGQRTAAATTAPWLAEPHLWHEERLQEVLERLQQGSLATLPSDLREGVEFYVSQSAGGQDVSQDTFYDDRELYKEVLKPAEKVVEAAYVRAPESPEDLQTIELLGGMSETSPHAILKMAKLLKAHEGSASVQVAGLNKLVTLLGDLRGTAPGPNAQGLVVMSVLPIVEASMSRFLQDQEVQRRGCVILRVYAAAEWSLSTLLENGGAEMAVRAGRAHLGDAEVCRSSVGALSTMVSGSKQNSVEWSRLRGSGASEFLTEVMRTHPLDERLEKVARTAIPFLKG